MKVAFVGDLHLTESCPKERVDVDYLQTLFDKLDFVYSKNDIVIYLGDIFDTPAVSYSALNRISRFLIEKKNSGKKTLSIIGNHDIPYRNKKLIKRTALGHLNLLGLIRVMNKRFSVCDVPISVVPFSNDIKFPIEDSRILLGHCFFENDFDPSYSIKRSDVEKSSYEYIILGHDHSPYSVEEVGNTKIIRFGSICRNTSHAFNLTLNEDRMRYVSFDMFEGHMENFQIERIPHKSPREVFSKELFLPSRGNEENKFSFLSKIDDLLSEFRSNEEDSTKVDTVLSVLSELNVDIKIRQYIRDKYLSLNMELK